MLRHIGCSGYWYNHWYGGFYPKDIPRKDWLKYYSENIDCVEINASFYGDISEDRYERWDEITNDDFSFIVKMNRNVTHDNFGSESPEEYIKKAQKLGNKLECFLLQFPPSFKQDGSNMVKLETLFKELPKEHLFASEVRNFTWMNDEYYDLCRKYNVASVFTKVPFKAYPKDPWLGFEVTANFVYTRFHGKRKWEYNEIDEIVGLSHDWPKKQFYLWNNDAYCNAITNTRMMEASF
jgi:uncharacterized protein YecE (DUF72 family)